MTALAATHPQCAICDATGSDVVGEQGKVRSNVRAFSREEFAIWRCNRCQSLHAKDEVDLAHYYARYPFHALPIDWRMRVMYENQVRRLRRAGIGPEHRILDYGCGKGDFLKYLSSRGFDHVAGFDEYSADFGDRSVLDKTYDCIFSQDVIEHVPSPNALLATFDGLVEPGGVIVIGTPNAAAIDIQDAEEYVHTLHLPYHRHILSKTALVDAGQKRGWELDRYYPTQYANTLFPFLNSRFFLYYMRLIDDSLDALLDPPQVAPLLLRFPLTLFWGLFGYFFARETDVMAVFRKPGKR
jgi:SAM-dependent methyltransferase